MNPSLPFSRSNFYITENNARFRIFHTKKEFEIYENGKLIGSAQRSINGNIFGPTEYQLSDGSKLMIEGAFKPRYTIVKLNGAKIYPESAKLDKTDRLKWLQALFLVISEAVFFAGFFSLGNTDIEVIQLLGKVNFAVGFILLLLMYLAYQHPNKYILYMFPIALVIPFVYSLSDRFHLVSLLYPVIAIVLWKQVRRFDKKIKS